MERVGPPTERERAKEDGLRSRRLTQAARRSWDALDVATVAADTFRTSMLDGLPAPVRRWLLHAIEPGAPRLRTARIEMHGEIRIGSWRPFEASQVLAPGRGFVWAATAHLGPLSITGSDRYVDGTGQMRWRLERIIPVLLRSGPDVARSGAGRLAGETMLIPAAALGDGVAWRPLSDRTATADVSVGGAPLHRVSIEVDDTGALRTIRLPRWGNPGKAPYREHPFGVEVEDEATFGSVTIPSRFTAGWWPGTDRWREGAFFRAVLDDLWLI